MTNQQATFPRKARLLQPSQYRHVFARGDKYVSGGFVVIVAASDNDHARLGMALAKRRIHRAVDRSRVKRVIRESFRHRLNLLPAIDIVVLARSKTAGMNNARLSTELAGIWQRIERSVHWNPTSGIHATHG